MRLHVFPPSPNAIKVLAAAALLELPYERVVVDLFTGEQKRRAFTALNPNQKMPVLEDDGFVLWESNAILQYLAGKRPERGFWPSDPAGKPTFRAGSSGRRSIGGRPAGRTSSSGS